MQSFTDPPLAVAAFEAAACKPAMVVCDQTLADVFGHDVVAGLLKRPDAARTQFIIFSGALLGGADDPVKAILGPQVSFLPKGVDLAPLSALIWKRLTATAGQEVQPAQPEVRTQTEWEIFLAILTHKLANVAGGLTMAFDLLKGECQQCGTFSLAQEGELAVLYKTSFLGFQQFVSELESFGVITDDAANQSMELPDILKGDPKATDLFARIPIQDRHKLAIATQLFLANGVRDAADMNATMLAAPSICLDDLVRQREKLAAMMNASRAISRAEFGKVIHDRFQEAFAFIDALK